MKPGSAAPPPITNTPNAEGEKKRGDKRNTSRKTRMWHLLFWLAVIGALGTLSRYWLDGLVLRWTGEKFPWGILVVNALGCFLFGVVYPLAEERLLISGETRFIILTGFMGSFTTFSTFTFQTAEFMRDAQWLMAGVNIISQIVLGLICMFAGLAIGSRL
jgi:CrcB protein